MNYTVFLICNVPIIYLIPTDFRESGLGTGSKPLLPQKGWFYSQKCRISQPTYNFIRFQRWFSETLHPILHLQYPTSVKNIFYLCTVTEQVADILLMKVFSFYPWSRIWKIHVYRDSNNTHCLYSYISFWYIRTSVGYCLFVHGYSRTFDQIN